MVPKVYAPVWHCIYCGSKDGTLGKEHIIPESLWGEHILPRASCRKCEKITGRFEGIVASQILGTFRQGMGAPSKRGPKKTIRFKVGDIEREMPADDVPPALVLPRLPLARVTTWNDEQRPLRGFWARYHTGLMEEALRKTGETEPIIPDFEPVSFFRMLAKIAHSYAYAELRSGERVDLMVRPLEWLLPDLILGRDNRFSRLIGGFNEELGPPKDRWHLINLGEFKMLSSHPGEPKRVPWRAESIGLQVYIRLFAWLGSPEYCVTVARFTDLGPDVQWPGHLGSGPIKGIHTEAMI